MFWCYVSELLSKQLKNFLETLSLFCESFFGLKFFYANNGMVLLLCALSRDQFAASQELLCHASNVLGQSLLQTANGKNAARRNALACFVKAAKLASYISVVHTTNCLYTQYRSQWCSARLQCERSKVQISPRAVVIITTATAIYSLGTGCAPLLPCLGRLNSPSSVWR